MAMWLIILNDICRIISENLASAASSIAGSEGKAMKAWQWPRLIRENAKSAINSWTPSGESVAA